MHLTAWQTASVILGVFVAGILLMSWLGKQIRGLYHAARRIEEALGVDDDGKTLRQNVTDLQGTVGDLKATLGNGIRSDVRRALELAQQNADGIARVEAKAEDAHRATNQLHAEVNIVIDAVVDDRARVWKVLGSMGHDRRQAAIEDV